MTRVDSLEMGELTDTAFYILLSLVEAKHGYLIMKSIETLTQHQISIGPASMYTTIKKLVAAGLIEQLPQEETRKTYIATRQGIDLLKKETERRREMVLHADEILSRKGV